MSAATAAVGAAGAAATATNAHTAPPQSEIIPIGAAYLGSTLSSLRAASASSSSGGKDGPTVFNPKTLTSRGRVQLPVNTVPWREQGLPGLSSSSSPKEGAKDGSKFNLYYELHGRGPRKIVFLMGLNTSCFGWLPQVEYFSKRPEEYSLLVLDNRGYGNSDAPAGRYS